MLSHVIAAIPQQQRPPALREGLCGDQIRGPPVSLHLMGPDDVLAVLTRRRDWEVTQQAQGTGWHPLAARPQWHRHREGAWRL